MQGRALHSPHAQRALEQAFIALRAVLFFGILATVNTFLEYLELFGVFFRVGAFTFGGGLAMLPVLERDLIQKRSWMTGEQLVDYFAIGQSTPGIIAVNVATFVGYNRKGIVGAIVATLGIIVPSIIVITVLAMFLESFADIVIVQKALRGINVAVAVLLLNAVWSFGKKTIIDAVTAFIALASFISMAFFNVPGYAVVLVTALLGLAFRFRPVRGSDGKGDAA